MQINEKDNYYRSETSVSVSSWGLSKLWLTVVILMVLSGGIFTVAKIIYSPMEVAQKITDPDRMIYNYEWYYQQHEDFKSLQNKIAIMKDSDDPQTQVNLQGLQMQLEDIRSKYNARSKMDTRNFLKSNSLPESL